MIAVGMVPREKRAALPRVGPAALAIVLVAGSPLLAGVFAEKQQAQTTEVQVSLVDIMGNNLLVAPAGEETAQGAVILSRNTELWVHGRGDVGFVLPGAWAEMTARPSEDALTTSELTVTLGPTQAQPAFQPVNPMDPTQGITVHGTVVQVSDDRSAVQLRVGNQAVVVGLAAPVTVNLRSSSLDLARPGALVTAEGVFVAPDRMAATRVTINLLEPLNSEDFLQAAEEQANPRDRRSARRQGRPSRTRPGAEPADDPAPGEAPEGEAPSASDDSDGESPQREAAPGPPVRQRGEAGDEAPDEEAA